MENMRIKFLVIGILCLLLVGSVSAYYCIQEEDNDAVKQFKSDINTLALKDDIKEHSITQEAFKLKIKYFNKCE